MAKKYKVEFFPRVKFTKITNKGTEIIDIIVDNKITSLDNIASFSY